MKSLIIAASIIVATYAMYNNAKWEKVNEMNYRGAESIIRTSLMSQFLEKDGECAGDTWSIGMVYSRLNFNLGSSSPTGRSYFVEILCPYNDQEIYSLYLTWVSDVTPSKTLVPNTSTIKFYEDLDEVYENDEELASVVSAEAAVFDLSEFFSYFIGLFRTVVCYYSELCYKFDDTALPQTQQ